MQDLPEIPLEEQDPNGNLYPKVSTKKPQGEVSLNLTSGDVAKRIVSLQLSADILDAAPDDLLRALGNGVNTGYNKVLKELEPSTRSMVKKFVNSVRRFSKFLPTLVKALGAVSSIFGFLSVLLYPSVEDILKEEFNTVNQKLDALSSKLDDVREELESNIRFHSWFETYNEYKNTIKNGEKKLQRTVSRVRDAAEVRDKLKWARHFLHYYETHDIEGTMDNIFRLTATRSTPTRPNLFQLYARQYKCDVKGLSQLMTVIMSLVFSGTKLMFAHSLFKSNNLNHAEEQVEETYAQLYKVRQQYEDNVLFCFNTAIARARHHTRDIMMHNPKLTGAPLTSKIKQEISELVPWYSWAVVQFSELKPISLNRDDCPLKSRGNRVFTEVRDERQVLVMWEDQENQQCHNADSANTFVSFQLCDGCNSTVLEASESILSGNRCPDYLTSTATTARIPCGNVNLPSKGKDKYSFLAGGFNSGQDACLAHGDDPCGGHGSCHSVPYSDEYMCFCYPQFWGENCEIWFNPSDHNAINMISGMRESFGISIGAPDVIDVYLEVKQFPSHLREMQTSIAASFEVSKHLTLYGDSFIKAEWVADLYNQLLTGNITEDSFGEEIERLNLNFNYVFWNLENMLHGDGILTSDDLLNSYKKSLNSASCTEGYSTKVLRFKKNILTLDEEVSEAQLRFLDWNRRRQDPSESQATLDQMQKVKDKAANRQQSYVHHWEATSCPKLHDEDLIENQCDQSLSYEGLNVTLHCRNDKQPTVESARCQRVNGTLAWSARPSCEYVWGSWSSWSICSRTCGVGERIRTRRKDSGETDNQTKPCEAHDCCMERYVDEILDCIFVF